MIENLTIRVRFYFFLAGIFLLVVLSYRMGIKKTFNLINENKTQAIKIDSVKSGSIELDMIKTKLVALQNQMPIQNTDVHQEILNVCSNFCAKNNLYVREYPEEERIVVGNSCMNINKIIIQGSFINSLKFIHFSESDKSNIGNISAVYFDKQKDPFSHKDYLSTTIFFSSLGSEIQQ